MQKLILVVISLLTYSTVFGQHKLEKLWQSDSTLLKGPESVLYDSKSNSLFVTSMHTGSVVQMDVNGKVMKADWITGLNSNKGSALYNGLFYTAQNSDVAVVDVKKSTIIKHIPIEGAKMLNDLVIDSKGVIYVSDSRGGKIYKIEDDEASLYLDNVKGVNGLLTVKSDLYFVASNTFQKANKKKEVTKIAEGFENGLDGIVMVSNNEFVLSQYKGILYYVKIGAPTEVLLDTRAQNIAANDIGYDSKTRTLFVPSFFTNLVIAYKLK